MSSAQFELSENERLDVVLHHHVVSNVIADEVVSISCDMKIDKSTRKSLKHIVRKIEPYNELVKQRIKCDAAECDSAGVNKIKVKVGRFSEVTLFVCSNCAEKFLGEMLELCIAEYYDPDVRESGYSKEDN